MSILNCKICVNVYIHSVLCTDITLSILLVVHELKFKLNWVWTKIWTFLWGSKFSSKPNPDNIAEQGDWRRGRAREEFIN